MFLLPQMPSSSLKLLFNNLKWASILWWILKKKKKSYKPADITSSFQHLLCIYFLNQWFFTDLILYLDLNYADWKSIISSKFTFILKDQIPQVVHQFKKRAKDCWFGKEKLLWHLCHKVVNCDLMFLTP